MPRLVVLPALAVLVGGVLSPDGMAQQAPESREQDFHRAVTLIETRADCTTAIKLLEPIAGGSDRALAARALVHIGGCQEKLAVDRARRAYRAVIDRFPEQAAAVAEARARLSALDRRTVAPPAVTTLRKLVADEPHVVGYVAEDGRFLTIIDAEGRLVLRDLHTGAGRTLFAMWPREATEPRCEVHLPIHASPDGRQIAYPCESGSQIELRLAPTDRSTLQGRTLLVSSPGEQFEPRYWRGNDRLVGQVTDASGAVRLVELTLSTKSQRVLLSLPQAPAWFSLSPDGRHVAFDAPSDVPGRSRVLMAPVGGASTVLADGGLPIWSPDGSQLLYISDQTGSASLWGQPVTGGIPRGSPAVLAGDLGRVAYPAGITRQGAFIFYRQTGLVDVYVAELDRAGRLVGTPRPVGAQAGSSRGPSWNAANELVYLTEFSTAGARQALGFSSPETGQSRQVTTGLAHLVRAQWTSDGRIAARGTARDGRVGLFLIDPKSGDIRQIVDVPPTAETSLGTYVPHPSQPRVLYERAGKEPRVMSHHLDSGEEHVAMTLEPRHRLGGVAGLAVSPVDGSLAFIRLGPSGTSLIHRSEDGLSRVVREPRPGEFFEGVSWMPSGDALLLTTSDSRDTGTERLSTAWRVTLATGAIEPFGLAMPGLRLLAPSPDGRWVAFTAGWPQRELWVVENFLRRASNTTWPLRPAAKKVK